MKTVTFSVFTDAKSPFWLTQIVFSDGKRLKKSTKVPVAGGLFRGEKLSRAQAKNRALMVAQELANAAAVWVHSNPSQEFTQLVRLHGIGLQKGGGAGRAGVGIVRRSSVCVRL